MLPTREELQRAAAKWQRNKGRCEDHRAYFFENWRALPGLRNYVAEEIAMRDNREIQIANLEAKIDLLHTALTGTVDLLEQPAYRDVAGSEDERSDYLRTLDDAFKALGRYVGTSDYDNAPRDAWLDAAAKQATKELLGDAYDSSPTDPHHGGKIWNPK